MKTPTLMAALLLVLSPTAVLGDPETDRKIENAAASSYNFRTVLDNQVKAEAEDGVVTLSGTVLDRHQKSLAEDTVRSLPGVIEVRNHLDVSAPGQERSDGWIALKIRSILMLRTNVSATNTDVTVRDGVVTLEGVAESDAQKELTETYARGVEGVRSVRNEITLMEPGEARRLADARTVGERIDDSSITAQVKYALLTHDATSALKTNVDTRDGAVRIRGTARSEAEKKLVTDLARAVRGVASVSNDMAVSASE